MAGLLPELAPLLPGGGSGESSLRGREGAREMKEGKESSREYKRETDSPRGGPELNMSQK